jgi:hypothetical protein
VLFVLSGLGAGSPGRRDRRPGYTPGWPLDPHRLLPVEPTTRASARSVSASLAWHALCLLADAQMLPGWRTPRRSHWPQLRWDPGPLPQHAGMGRQAMSPVCPGSWCFVGGAPAERLDAGEALPPHYDAVKSLQPPLAARRARRGRSAIAAARACRSSATSPSPRGLPQDAPGLAAPPPPGCRRARRRATHELGAAAASATTRRRSCRRLSTFLRQNPLGITVSWWDPPSAH